MYKIKKLNSQKKVPSEALQESTKLFENKNCSDSEFLENYIEGRKRARRLSINNRELLFAASEGNLVELERLAKDGADLQYEDADGNIPLHYAVVSKNLEVVSFLID